MFEAESSIFAAASLTVQAKAIISSLDTHLLRPLKKTLPRYSWTTQLLSLVSQVVVKKRHLAADLIKTWTREKLALEMLKLTGEVLPCWHANATQLQHQLWSKVRRPKRFNDVISWHPPPHLFKTQLFFSSKFSHGNKRSGEISFLRRSSSYLLD